MGSSPAGRAIPLRSSRVDLSALLGATSVGEALATAVDLAAPREIVPGWATVEIERAIGSGLRTAASAGDELLGAFGAVVAVGRGRRVVLLEPSTEGLLAAALARHGEGWVAAYLVPGDVSALARLRAAGFRLSVVGQGPLGTQRRVLVGPRDGPFILVVGEG